MHFPAAQFRFEANAVIAVGGADFAAELDGKAIATWQPAFAKQDSVLRFAERVSGNRAYLAVAGGFAVADYDCLSNYMEGDIGYLLHIESDEG